MAIKPNSKGVVTGTNKNEKITWTNSKEWKKTLTVNALDGADTIDFKKSTYKNNKLNGGNGNDTIYGGSNIDIIHGNNDNDKLYGYNGNDTLYGDAGNDQLFGGNGNDTLNGGAGNDTLKGEAGNDTLKGGAGNDQLTGGKGNDKLYTEAGNDTVIFNSGDGNDTLYKGSGSDTLQFNNFANISKLKSGLKMSKSGNNLVIKYTSKDSVTLSNYFKNGTSVVKLKAKDGKTTSFTDFFGSYIFNTYTGKKDKANKITGSALNDIIKGNNKNDTLNGGNGNDKIYGYAGNDTIKGGNGNDYIEGGDGNDELYGEAGNDTIKGGKGNDTINAGKGNNRIILDSTNGTDTIISGGGVDTIVLDAAMNQGTFQVNWNNNDLVLSGLKNNGKVILKGYGNGNHSAQWLEFNGNKVRTDSYVQHEVTTEPIPGSLKVYNGTNRPDDIQVNVGNNSYIEHSVINAYAGDDTITLNNAVYFTVNPGSGNDVIQTTGQTAFGTIKIARNGGSDTFIGIENANWRYQAVLDASTITNGVFDNSLLVRRAGNIEYILGERTEDDLIIKLTDGNTFTVKNYFTPKNAYDYNWENMAFVSSPDNTSSLNSYLELYEPKTITLNKTNNTLNKEAYNGRYIVDASENANYTVKLGNGSQSNIYFDKKGNHTVKLGNGDSNAVIINKDGNHSVTVGDGDRNNIELGSYIHETAVMEGPQQPPTPINGNQTVNAGNGDRNTIKIATNNNSNVTVGSGNSNYIYIDNAKESTTATGNGYGNLIKSYATDKNTITTGTGQNTIFVGYNDGTKVSNDTIHSYGSDQISEFNANTQITFEGDGSTKGKTIIAKVDVGSNAPKIQAVVNNVENAQTANLVVAPVVGALMPYYSLYDDNNDGVYDVVYSAINMSNGIDGDREIVVKDAYNHGNYVASMTDPTQAKLCDMGRAGIYTFNYSDSSIYSNSIVVVDSNGNDVITAAGDKIVSLHSGINTLTVDDVGTDSGIVFVNGGKNTINNGGKASIKVNGGENTINLSGENIDKKIYMASGATANVNGVFNLGSDGVTSFDFNTNDCNDVMVYRASGSKDLSLVTRHFGAEAVLKDVMATTTSIAIADDNLLYNTKVTNTAGIDEVSLYDLWSYCDMTHDNTHTFARNEYFENDSKENDFFVDGTTENDTYSHFSIKEWGKDVICDLGGNDTLVIGYDSTHNDSFLTDFDTFFHVYKQDGQWVVDDLYFVNDIRNMQTNAPISGDWFNSGENEYICIKDYFGDGKIETVRDYNYATLSSAKLDDIKSAVVSWLETNGFDSTMDAINSFDHNTASDWTDFKALYNQPGQDYSCAWVQPK